MINLLIVLWSAYYAPQQAAVTSEPKAGIFGRVVSAGTHEPIRRAAIKVISGKDELNEFTDGEGRFRFPSLAPGDYLLIAHRDGFTDRAYKVERSDFVEQKELPVQLLPQAVIAGKTVDGLGQPLGSAQVEALGSLSPGGKLEVIASVTTNDLGEYRLSGLNPGAYRLRASYHGGGGEFDPTPRTTASSYYGGSEKASEIRVKAGSLISGIDFTLNPARPATVRGTLRTESGVLNDAVTLWISGRTGEGGHNATGKDGKFEITDVGPGSYTISAETLAVGAEAMRIAPPGIEQNPDILAMRKKMLDDLSKSEPLFGMTTVEVHGADVDSVEVVLRPLAEIQGEFRWEDGGTKNPTPGTVYFMQTDRITAMPMMMVQSDQDGKFTIRLIPGEYHVAFDEEINKVGVQRVTLDDKPITEWKLQIDGPAETKKLIIVLGGKR